MSEERITRKIGVPVEQARAVAAHLRATAEAAATGGAFMYRDEAARERARQHLEDLADGLEALAEAAEAAEHGRTQEAADDQPTRDARDAAALALRQAMIEAKPYLESGFGAAAVDAYGLAGDVARRPEDLAAQVSNTLALLQANPQQQAGRFGAAADTAAVTAVLAPLLSALSVALAAVKQEKTEYQEALNLRDQLLAQLLSALDAAEHIGAAALTLAGRGDLTRSLRTIRRRSARSSSASPPQDDAPLADDPTLTAPAAAIADPTSTADA